MSKTNIKVVCRIRPLNELEKNTDGGAQSVTHTDTTIKVKAKDQTDQTSFNFDHIFGVDSSQDEVFDKVAKPILTRLMDGYNGTIFAYGQTSSGKTFTMEGVDIPGQEEKRGIIPRVMNNLFELIENSSKDVEFKVKVSFLELYNESIRDLIDTRKINLEVREDGAKGIFIKDLTETYVWTPEEIKNVHKSGSKNRTTAATRMNDRSSRSHSVFIIHVLQENTVTGDRLQSKLCLVDLAGSERVGKTHVDGKQLDEAKNINKSLTQLGIVINALTERATKEHIPYRDSKLTRLLQESLGGNSQTSLILACTMSSYNAQETLSTLRFGNRAKNIKNDPQINIKKSEKEMIDEYEKKIQIQNEMIKKLQQQQQLDGKGKGGSKEGDLKDKLELENMAQQIKKLKEAEKEYQKEIKKQSEDIFNLNGKVQLYERQIEEITHAKTLEAGESTLKARYLASMNKLKNDLTLMSMAQNYKPPGTAGNEKQPPQEQQDQFNKEALILSSIEKTIEMLSKMEENLEENEKLGRLNTDDSTAEANLIQGLGSNKEEMTNLGDQSSKIQRGIIGKFKGASALKPLAKRLQNIIYEQVIIPKRQTIIRPIRGGGGNVQKDNLMKSEKPTMLHGVIDDKIVADLQNSLKEKTEQVDKLLEEVTFLRNDIYEKDSQIQALHNERQTYISETEMENQKQEEQKEGDSDLTDNDHKAEISDQKEEDSPLVKDDKKINVIFKSSGGAKLKQALASLQQARKETSHLTKNLNAENPIASYFMDVFETNSKKIMANIMESSGKKEKLAQDQINQALELTQFVKKSIITFNDEQSPIHAKLNEKIAAHDRALVEGGIYAKIYIKQESLELLNNSKSLYVYYNTFYWTAINLFGAYRSLSTGIVAAKTESSTSGSLLVSGAKQIAKYGGEALKGVPFVGGLISALDTIIDDIYSAYKEAQLENKVVIINSIIQNKCGQEEDISINIKKIAMALTKAKKLVPHPKPIVRSKFQKGINWLKDQIESTKDHILSKVKLPEKDIPEVNDALMDVTAFIAYLCKNHKKIIADKSPLDVICTEILNQDLLGELLEDVANRKVKKTISCCLLPMLGRKKQDKK